MALLERFQGQFSARTSQEQSADEGDSVRIFYCSRTHSQLSQFSGELRRVVFPSSIPSMENGDELETLEENVKHLSLGSRKNLCINPSVRDLGNSTVINERCLDLQQPNVASDKKCSYFSSKDDEALVLQFRDHVLATVKDIEDISKIGEQIGICPYYATRSVIQHSEVSYNRMSRKAYTTDPDCPALDCDPPIPATSTAICSYGTRFIYQGPRGHNR